MTEHTRAATVAVQPQDAWDRLAALAFGVGGSVGGCSEAVHAYECTCVLPPQTPASAPDTPYPADDEYPDYTDAEGAGTGIAD